LISDSKDMEQFKPDIHVWLEPNSDVLLELPMYIEQLLKSFLAAPISRDKEMFTAFLLCTQFENEF